MVLVVCSSHHPRTSTVRLVRGRGGAMIGAVIGPGIIVPIVAVAILVAGRASSSSSAISTASSPTPIPTPASPSGARLTAAALHRLPTPPWRVVYEVANDSLGGIDHVLIGPAGILAITTSLSRMPSPSTERPSPETVAKGAIARGDLDDVLRRCAMESTGHVTIFWGRGRRRRHGRRRHRPRKHRRLRSSHR